MNTKNLYRKTKNVARGVALAGLTVLSLAGCGSEVPVLEGKITRESFYPKKSFNSSDRYDALVELSSGEKIVVSHYSQNARAIDLKYDVGDSVTVTKDDRGRYKILDDSILN